MKSNKKINIYIIDDYPSSQTNGIGVYLTELVKVLKKISYIQITLIDFHSPKKEFDIVEKDDIQHIIIPFILPYINYFEDSFTISQLLALHINDSTQNIFLINHSPCHRLVKSLKEVFPLSKTLFIVHDLSWTTPLLGDIKKLRYIIKNKESDKIKKDYDHILKAIEKVCLLFNLIDNIICLSEDTLHILHEIYVVDYRKVFCIQNFLTDTFSKLSAKQKEKIKQKYHISNEEKILLFVGRLTTPKGATVVINSFKNVLKKYPNCRLIFAGTPVNTEEILKLGKSALSKTSYTGQIPHNELNKLYKIANIGIIPSYTEQCSYAGIEMLMHGLPIVASNGFGVRNMFKDGINASIAKIGIIDNPKEFEANLTDSILKLLSSDKDCNILSQNARKTYKERYTIEIAVKNYENLLNNII